MVKTVTWKKRLAQFRTNPTTLNLGQKIKIKKLQTLITRNVSTRGELVPSEASTTSSSGDTRVRMTGLTVHTVVRIGRKGSTSSFHNQRSILRLHSIPPYRSGCAYAPGSRYFCSCAPPPLLPSQESFIP